LKRYKRSPARLIRVFIAVMIICTSLFVHRVYAEDASEMDVILSRQSESNEIKKIEKQLRKYSDEDFENIMDGYDPGSIIGDAAKGKFRIDVPGIVQRAAQYIFREIYMNISILIKLLVLVVLCAILRNLQVSFMNGSVGEIAFYACYIAVVTTATISFASAMKLGIGVIDRMVDFMYASLPVLITLLVSGGNLTTAGIFQPVMLMIVETSAVIIKNMFVPLIYLSTVLSIVNNISEKVQISKLAGLLKQVAGWGLGIILTLSVAVVSIQGSLGAVVDGVTSKAAKFAIGAFIPVAGKYLADATDTVLGSMLLLKNAAGIAVMTGIIGICLVTLLKIAALIAIYKVACVLVEPLSEKRITDCLNEISGSMTYILGIAASVAFMFLISVTALISAGNLSAMVR